MRAQLRHAHVITWTVMTLASLLLAVLIAYPSAFRSDLGRSLTIKLLVKVHAVPPTALVTAVASATSDSEAPSTSASAIVQALVPAPEPEPIEWLTKLANNRMTTRPITLYAPLDMTWTNQQRHLLSKQAINVVNWDPRQPPPARRDTLSKDVVFWIQPDAHKQWSVHATFTDLLARESTDTGTITDFDIIKLIVMSDAVVAQQRWMEAHPAPALPQSLALPSFQFVIIPSDAGMVNLFWSSLSMLMLVVVFLSSNLLGTTWLSMRKEGVLEPLMALPGPTMMVPAMIAITDLLWPCMVMAAAALMAWVGLTSQGVPVFWMDTLKMLVLCAAVLLAVTSLLRLVMCWFEAPWWSSLSIVVSALLEWPLMMATMSSLDGPNSMSLALSQPWSWLLAPLFGALSIVLWRLTAWRLDASRRQWYKKP